MARVFDVLLHGVVVGTLRQSDSGFIGFRFNEAYRGRRRRPVLGQIFVDKIDAEHVGKQRELPPFFANLVPEGELRPLLEDKLGVERGDDLALLEFVGRDLPGAVEIRRRFEADDSRPTEGGERVEPRVLEADDEELRFSLAGMQLKFSVVRAKDKITLPVRGERGDAILKLDSDRFPRVVENEYTMLAWARRAGFDVPGAEIVSHDRLRGLLANYAEPGVRALLISRYDRPDPQRRIHQEDFAQVLNARPQNKYGNVTFERLAFIVENMIDAEARDEFIRRLVFMIASGNSDAHLKNWSVVYHDDFNCSLSPLYDQVATVAWPSVRQKVALKLAGRQRFEHLGPDSFEELAARIRMPPRHVIGLVETTLEELRQAWSGLRQSESWVLPDDHERALTEHWRRTPLLAPLR